MEFSNTTSKDGLIQTIEFFAGLSDGDISGDSTKLKRITGRINRAFDKVLPYVLSYTDHIRWDDANHSDKPVGTINLVSGQNTYVVSQDDNNLDILNLVGVRILRGASATQYESIERITLDDWRAQLAISPNSADSGIPTGFVENENVLNLYPNPNYSATNGIKLFFEREPSYFVSSDTTKEPGIPKPFHELLALIAALDWVRVYNNTNTTLINGLREDIQKMKEDLSDMIEKRNPTRRRITTPYGGGVGGWQSGKIGRTYGDSNE